MSSSTTTLSIVEFAHPFTLFDKWFQEAKEAKGEVWPNALSLATATPDGIPSVRTVLMQRHEIGRVAWYTNYTSRKGEELDANPRAAILFYWNKLARQVRMEGTVVKGTKEESDEYFASRPRDSRIASIASAQSKVLEGGTAQLNAEVEEMKKKFRVEVDPDAQRQQKDGEDASENAPVVQLLDVPRPDHMGLFWLTPHKIEFWEEGAFRVHTRNVYDLVETDGDSKTKAWKHYMLYP